MSKYVFDKKKYIKYCVYDVIVIQVSIFIILFWGKFNGIDDLIIGIIAIDIAMSIYLVWLMKQDLRTSIQIADGKLIYVRFEQKGLDKKYIEPSDISKIEVSKRVARDFYTKKSITIRSKYNIIIIPIKFIIDGDLFLKELIEITANNERIKVEQGVYDMLEKQ